MDYSIRTAVLKETSSPDGYLSVNTYALRVESILRLRICVEGDHVECSLRYMRCSRVLSINSTESEEENYNAFDGIF